MTAAALADHHFTLGVRQQAAGAAAQAASSFRRALALWPGCAAAWANLGLLHHDAGRFRAAADCQRRALALDPVGYESAINLGAALTRLGDDAAAEAAWRRAAAPRPDHPAPWSNLGALLAGGGRDSDALACCLHALKLEPGHAGARFNLGYLLLRQGRLAEGFLCHESRPAVAHLQSRLDGPRWGGDDLQGRSLLVLSDAGHGDLIQMARYGRLLHDRGAGFVRLVCPPALKRLLTGAPGFDDVLEWRDVLPRSAWDLWTPAMSLPHLFGTALHSIPADGPYLRADAARRAHWRARLRATQPAGAPQVRLVGLAWRGNPAHENDAERSLHDTAVLAPLAPLARRLGLRFVSLQHGHDGALPAGVGPAPGALGDFAETAALVAELDLVIGIDSATVHLAAALGVPTWVLLNQHRTDWRWLDERSDSPWYPGAMRLFRQPRRGDWPSVVTELVAALHGWAAAPR
jgi:Tfp pilus assembly protein PilF